MRRRALVNLILFKSFGEVFDGWLVRRGADQWLICVDSVLVTICEAGRKEERRGEGMGPRSGR